MGLLYVFVMRFAETKVVAEYVQSNSVVYEAIAYVEYGFYGLAVTVSTISMIYHFVRRVKGKKVGDKDEKGSRDD